MWSFKFMNDNEKKIEIVFVKVPSHAGVKYNEEADLLAKRSLLNRGYKTYRDGSVYFSGYSIEDWLEIVEIVNEEKQGLGDFEQLTTKIVDFGNREKIEVKQGSKKVSISCYKKSPNAYVQGKISSLLEIIIATAISVLDSSQEVVEKLNFYRATNIEESEVEIKFDELLPDYSGNTTDKIYYNLLSAVFNTMVSGFMPDYTCLVTPIFRAYEFCLHRILGDNLGLATEKDGKNIFAYFSKNASGTYECNNSTNSKLTSEQLSLLNELYSNYNLVRHVYSHWSYEEIDTAVITDVNDAREKIIKGLTLINKYYKLF